MKTVVEEIKKWMEETSEEEFDPNQLPDGYLCPKCNEWLEIEDWSSFLTIIEHLEQHIKNLQFQVNSWEDANTQYGFLG